jgi:hypothetical protein
MILANVNIGTGPSAGDGDPLRSAFTTINNNFQIVTNNVNALTNSVTSVAGRNGNVVLTINDIIGWSTIVTQANINATVNTANIGMKGYVDSVAGGSYSNVQVQSYLTTNGYTNTVNTAAISANVLTLDFNLSTQIVTHNANISNVAISNGPGNLSTKSMTVILSQDATGGRTIAGYYKTQDGLGLDINTTALAVNIYTFLAVNNGSGTSLYAFSNGTNFI